MFVEIPLLLWHQLDQFKEERLEVSYMQMYVNMQAYISNCYACVDVHYSCNIIIGRDGPNITYT